MREAHGSTVDRPLLLVVDDSDADQYLIRWILRDLGADVHLEQCRDGDQAVARLCSPTAAPPDLVLLDINMPRRSGHDVLQILSERLPKRSFPILTFSTSSSPADVECSELFGADGYLCKPGNLRDFTALLEDLVDQYLSDQPTLEAASSG